MKIKVPNKELELKVEEISHPMPPYVSWLCNSTSAITQLQFANSKQILRYLVFVLVSFRKLPMPITTPPGEAPA